MKDNRGKCNIEDKERDEVRVMVPDLSTEEDDPSAKVIDGDEAGDKGVENKLALHVYERWHQSQ